jgi:transcription initiation factor TFIIIB Brf1 subunit/transcription initiation factor TFIIB
MRIEGFQVCPRCEQNGLPRIDPASLANAVRCQRCGAVIERSELERGNDAGN